jgi:hypothetical protein
VCKDWKEWKGINKWTTEMWNCYCLYVTPKIQVMKFNDQCDSTNKTLGLSEVIVMRVSPQGWD